MKIFRWLIMVPGALCALMLGSIIGGIALSMFGSQSLTDAGSAFLGPFAFAFTVGLLAPSGRSKTTLVFACVFVFLALLNFILSVGTNIEGFADRCALDKILIPVSQILGALYAISLLPAIIISGTSLEPLWRSLITLGVVVLLLGILISTAGLLVGLFGPTWVGFTTGLGVLVIGAATWLFPFCHLFLRFRRAEVAIKESFRHE